VGAALIFPISVSVLTNACPSVRANHAVGLAYGIAGLGPADRWTAHRDGRLAVDIRAERSACARRTDHRSMEHHRILRRVGGVPHRLRWAGAHHRRNWLVHVDI